MRSAVSSTKQVEGPMRSWSGKPGLPGDPPDSDSLSDKEKSSPHSLIPAADTSVADRNGVWNKRGRPVGSWKILSLMFSGSCPLSCFPDITGLLVCNIRDNELKMLDCV